jgi:hypothetical protein
MLLFLKSSTDSFFHQQEYLLGLAITRSGRLLLGAWPKISKERLTKSYLGNGLSIIV